MAIYNFTLKISYNANGGSGAPSQQTATAISQGLPYTISATLSATVPTRSGYTFLGWSKSSSSTSASYSAGGTITQYFEEAGSISVTLYAVWSARKSTISLHDGTTAATIDTSTTIDITRYNNSYTHTITYTFGNASGTIVTKTSSTSVSWSIPDILANQIPNSTKGVCTLTCTTFDGNTSLGKTTLNITLYVKQSVKVTIGTVSVSEGYPSMPSGISVYVQGKSKWVFSIGNVTSGAFGATVSSISTTVNGKTYSGASFTTDTLATAGSTSYTITLTDSRGRTDAKSGSFWVYQYHAPTPVITSVVRDDNAPSTALVSYTWNVSSINNQNAKTIRVKYKLTTASSYSQATSFTPSSYSGSSTYTLNPSPSGLDTAYPYNIQIELSDSFTTASYSLTLSSSGSRYIECDIATQTVKFPLNVQFIGDANTQYGNLSKTGETASDTPSSSSLASATSTYITKANLTLSAGTYLVEFGATFAQNQTGRRCAILSTTQNSDTAHIRGSGAKTNAVPGESTYLSATTVISISSTTTYYLNLWQNSGSSLTVYPFIRTVRVV